MLLLVLLGAVTDCPRNCGTVENGGGTCRIRPSDGATICASCDSHRLRLKGACLLSVPCKARRVSSGRLKGQGCKCLDDRCHNCVRTRAGDTCKACRDGSYLLDGRCVDTCPDHLARHGISLFGRKCLEPFTCKSGRIYDGKYEPSNTSSLVAREVSYGCRCPAPSNTVSYPLPAA